MKRIEAFFLVFLLLPGFAAAQQSTPFTANPGSCSLDGRLSQALHDATSPQDQLAAARKIFEEDSRVSDEFLKDALQFVQNDSLEVQRKALMVAWDQKLSWVTAQLNCLVQENVFSAEQADKFLELYVLGNRPFRKIFQDLYRAGLPKGERRSVDLSSPQYLDAFDLAVEKGVKRSAGALGEEVAKFGFRNNSSLQVLVDGKPFREQAIETVRNAGRFAHLSSLHMAEDRFGKVLATELVAKKMGYRDGDELSAHLQQNHWDLVNDAEDIRNDFVRQKLDEKVRLGEMTADQATEILGDPDRMNKTYLQLTKAFEIRLLLDLYNTHLSPIKNADLGKHNILPVLRSYGATVAYVASLFWLNDHAKIVMSEHEAVVSGGNFIDKVMNWNWSRIEFHDMAIKVKGQLVNDLNRFFAMEYNRHLYVSLFGRWIDIPGHLVGRYRNAQFDPIDADRRAEDGTLYYFPPENDNPSEGRSPARLIYTDRGKFGKSVTAKALQKVVQDSQDHFYSENPFFTDGGVARQLIRKAESLHLRREKELNGEIIKGRPIKATCDLAKIHQRPSKRAIVVILPAHHDQFLVKLANDSLLNSLLNAGVDVCKWSGARYNQHKEEAVHGASGELYDRIRRDPEKGYKDDAMLHSKVWSADGKLGYIGSANHTARSQQGDIEMGIMTADSVVVADIDENIMEMDLWNSEPTRTRKINYVWGPLRVFFTRILPVM